jgi:hypothetical protein
MSAVRITDPTLVDAAASLNRSDGKDTLSTRRVNVMRFGYAFIGLGLAIVKWPDLIQNAHTVPVTEGVVLCMLTAMSLLAFLGIRYPVQLLPILVFEVAWKLIWIAAVAVPLLVAGDMNTETGEMLFRCSFVVVILAVVPWRFVWARYVRAGGEAWR